MMDITEYALIKETYLDERPVFGQISSIILLKSLNRLR